MFFQSRAERREKIKEALEGMDRSDTFRLGLIEGGKVGLAVGLVVGFVAAASLAQPDHPSVDDPQRRGGALPPVEVTPE